MSGGLAGTTADFSGSVDAGGGLLVDGLTGTQNALRVVTGGTEKFAVKADGSTFFVGDVNLYANLDLQDNDKILLGTGDDFQFYHFGHIWTHPFMFVCAQTQIGVSISKNIDHNIPNVRAC